MSCWMIEPFEGAVNFRPDLSGSTLFALCLERLQAIRHGAPKLRPVREILPAPPLRIAPEHGLVADRAALVIRLANEFSEFRIHRDEVVAAVHRQQMRGAVGADARQRLVAVEKV